MNNAIKRRWAMVANALLVFVIGMLAIKALAASAKAEFFADWAQQRTSRNLVSRAVSIAAFVAFGAQLSCFIALWCKWVSLQSGLILATLCAVSLGLLMDAMASAAGSFQESAFEREVMIKTSATEAQLIDVLGASGFRVVFTGVRSDAHLAVVIPVKRDIAAELETHLLNHGITAEVSKAPSRE